MGMRDTARSLRTQERQRKEEALRGMGANQVPQRDGKSLLRSLARPSLTGDEVPHEPYGPMWQAH